MLGHERGSQPTVGDLAGHLETLRRQRRQIDGDVGARLGADTQRLALAARQRQLVVLSPVVDLRLAGDDLAHDFDVLASASPGLPVRDAIPAFGDLWTGGTETE